jgi:hypothetical protein
MAWIGPIASPVGPEHRGGDDGDDPDQDPHDEEGTQDGCDRVAHGYIQSRGRK